MEKAKMKKEQRIRRQFEQQKKRRTMRVLVWTFSAAAVALIAALVIFWPKPGPLHLANENMPTVGPADAKVKITEFGDFKCPACAIFSQTVMPKIKAEYIDSGKASFSYANYNIIGPDSFTAAHAGQAIYHQSNEQFWLFYNAVFKNQPDEHSRWATPDNLVEIAKSSGLKLDFDKLKKDIENETYADEVNSQQSFAVKNNFSSTPTVLINGRKLDSNTAFNYEKLKAEIETALQEAKG